MTGKNEDASAPTVFAVSQKRPLIPGDPWLFILGAACIALATILENPDMGLVKTSYAHSAVMVPTTGPAVVQPLQERFVHSIQQAKTWIAFVKEVGFALIIAWGVSYFIDRYAKIKELEEQTRKIGEIGRSVFHGVFEIFHDESYVNAVVVNNLLEPIIRREMEIEYTIEPLSAEERRALKIEPGRFVKFTQKLTCTFENQSAKPVNFTMKPGVHVRSGAIGKSAGIKKMRIGDTEYTQAEIDAISTLNEDYKSYEFPHPLAPGKSVPVTVKAVTYKELSDTEVFGNHQPVYEKLTLRVFNRVPEIKKLGIRNLTATHAEHEVEEVGREERWVFRGAIFPKDSVALWWRILEDDGAEDGASAPEEVQTAVTKPEQAPQRTNQSPLVPASGEGKAGK